MHFFLSQSGPRVFIPRDNHVTNGVDTSGCKPRGYGSWLKYYKQHAGEVNTCSVFRCTRTDLVGAHVSTRETHLFCIIPLCRCLLYTSPSPRDGLLSRMPSSA